MLEVKNKSCFNFLAERLALSSCLWRSTNKRWWGLLWSCSEQLTQHNQSVLCAQSWWLCPSYVRVLVEHRPECALLCHAEESQISLKKLIQGIQSKKTLRYYSFNDVVGLLRYRSHSMCTYLSLSIILPRRVLWDTISTRPLWKSWS